SRAVHLPARPARPPPPRARPRGHRARHALPADDRAGHGERRRGHRVLRLQPLRRAERGGRRPGRVRHAGQRVPRRLPSEGRDPDSGYDTALREFVEAGCGDEEFQAMLADFVGPLVGAGRVSSLAATLLKLTSPGVADTYQGGELWDLSLVDPDNRRPVDYALRERMLRAFGSPGQSNGLGAQLLASWPDGRVKLWLTWQLMRLRQRHAAWLQDAGYA